MPRHFSVWAPAGTVVGGSKDEEEERRDSGQTLLVWRPRATLRGLLPVTVKNDAALS